MKVTEIKAQVTTNDERTIYTATAEVNGKVLTAVHDGNNIRSLANTLAVEVNAHMPEGEVYFLLVYTSKGRLVQTCRGTGSAL